jgi:hypothetical protein
MQRIDTLGIMYQQFRIYRVRGPKPTGSVMIDCLLEHLLQVHCWGNFKRGLGKADNTEKLLNFSSSVVPYFSCLRARLGVDFCSLSCGILYVRRLGEKRLWACVLSADQH